MSLASIKSPKHCDNQGVNISKRWKRLLYSFSTCLFSVLLLGLVIWLILHPSKPDFYLKEADIYQFNLSAPHLLNSTIQITIVSKNPNQKVGVYYDQLQVYASYKGQEITLRSSLPPFYQGNGDSNLLTASLIGTGIPVAPSFGYEMGRDRIAGKLTLSLKLDGRIRWKVGTWVSGSYRLNVDCVALMALGPNIGPGVPISKQGTQCSATV